LGKKPQEEEKKEAIEEESKEEHKNERVERKVEQHDPFEEVIKKLKSDLGILEDKKARVYVNHKFKCLSTNLPFLIKDKE